MNIILNISEFRQKTKMTQAELADKLNVDRSTISKWETGESRPGLERLIKIAEIFGCKINDLIA